MQYGVPLLDTMAGASRVHGCLLGITRAPLQGLQLHTMLRLKGSSRSSLLACGVLIGVLS